MVETVVSLLCKIVKNINIIIDCLPDGTIHTWLMSVSRSAFGATST